MNKLFICSESYAGQLPFGSAVVNAMKAEDVFGIFVCSPQCDYRKTIEPNSYKYVFLDFPQGKFSKLFFRIYPWRLIREINNLCKKHNIQTIGLLTQDTSLAFSIGWLKKKAKVFYVVHDLVPHEQKFYGLAAWFLHAVLLRYRAGYLTKRVDNLVTSSQAQFDWMKVNFKQKNIFFHNFPSLITDSVKHGSQPVDELKGISDYILFFGLIEQYKGVDILYRAYLEYPDSKKPLVIAGKGHIYFQRQNKEDGVTFINRYIADQEVKALFANAFCVVFPYISATQSGVLSLAYYFKTPSVVSNVPYFRDLIAGQKTSMSFDISKPDTLMEMISRLDAEQGARLKESAYQFYLKHYSEESLKQQLQSIYN